MTATANKILKKEGSTNHGHLVVVVLELIRIGMKRTLLIYPQMKNLLVPRNQNLRNSLKKSRSLMNTLVHLQIHFNLPLKPLIQVSHKKVPFFPPPIGTSRSSAQDKPEDTIKAKHATNLSILEKTNLLLERMMKLHPEGTEHHVKYKELFEKNVLDQIEIMGLMHI